jgi:phosphatidylethanolamine/phosphatidyl-N-methylethanolamine N-methyltransferase
MYPIIDYFLDIHKKHLYQQIQKLPPGNLLEVGVGTGKHIQKYHPHKVSAIDNHAAMITLAQKQNLPHVEFMIMDGAKTNFADESFDYVVLSHILAVVKNPNTLINEACRVLKPDGKILILNHFTPKNPLAIVDYLFQPFAKWFNFQSYFTIKKINSIHLQKIQFQQKIGLLKYYQIIVLGKN